eukprot:TRINITY_DN32202_c0_g1_i1.p3 TRINITY_DN32202_c0_g1~~TRINITY_DN32202_c0_g1_i1.p3  ORF type:complete len:126 (-),score=42.26 TRINITY_DN32202_c0_g1_i1:141-518(-)
MVRFRFEGDPQHVLAIDEVELTGFAPKISHPNPHPLSSYSVGQRHDFRSAIAQQERSRNLRNRERTQEIRIAEAMAAELATLKKQISIAQQQIVPTHSSADPQSSDLPIAMGTCLLYTSPSPRDS